MGENTEYIFDWDSGEHLKKEGSDFVTNALKQSKASQFNWDTGEHSYVAELPEEGHWEGWIKPSLEEALGGIKALPETAATLATGMAGFPVAGLIGYKEWIDTGGMEGSLEKAVEAMDDFLSDYSYQPKGETAQKSVELAMKPIELGQWAAKKAGDYTLKLTGDVDLSVGVATSVEFAALELIGKGLGKMRAKKLPHQKLLKQKFSPKEIKAIKVDLLEIQKREIAKRINKMRTEPKPLARQVRAEGDIRGIPPQKAAGESAQVFMDEFAQPQKPSGMDALRAQLAKDGVMGGQVAAGMKPPYKGPPVILPDAPARFRVGTGLVDPEFFLRKRHQAAIRHATPKVKAEYGTIERGIKVPEEGVREFGEKIKNRGIVPGSKPPGIVKDRVKVTPEPKPEKSPKPVAKQKAKDGTTLSMFGTQGAYEALVAEAAKMKKAAQDFKQKAVNLIDVESRFGSSKETGFHVKNLFSMQDRWESWTLEQIKKVAKESGYNKDVLSSAPLIIESKKALSKADPVMKQIGESYNAFKKELEAEYNKRGVKFNFKDRIVNEIEGLLEIADPSEIPDLRKALATAKDLNWVHIPTAAWFETKLSDPVGATQALKILATQKRKSLNIRSLIDRKLIQAEDVNLADIMASQGRRAGRDFAILNIRNAALEDGMAVSKYAVLHGKKVKAALPHSFMELSTQQAPVFKDHYVHKILGDYLQSEIFGRGLDLGPINKWMSLSKMAAFINPGILPMYDVNQHAIVATFGKWSGKKPVANIPSYYMAKGAKHYYKRTPEYYEALSEGISSKPYNNPFNTWEGLVEWAQMSGKQQTLRMLKSLYPHKMIPSIYNASWYIAWEADVAVRMGTYFMFRDKGMTPRLAAQTAAKVHSDYASVPPKTRRALNIPFFTPTFKITMGKFWGRMGVDALKAAKNFTTLQRPDVETAAYAKGLLGLAVINEAYDLYMTKFLGFERDEWGRRYYKEIDTDDGIKELTTTWSVPSNLWLKYMYRAADATVPEEDKPMLKFLKSNRWEFHPVWRTAYDLTTNDNGVGDPIHNISDSEPAKLRKQVGYAATSIVALFRGFSAQPSNKEARKRFAKETSSLFELATRPFTFKYMRTPRDLNRKFRLNKMMDHFNNLIRRKLEKGEDLSEEEMKVIEDKFLSITHGEI